MPHGHGFIAATNVNRAGKRRARPTRTTDTRALLQRLAQRLEHVPPELRAARRTRGRPGRPTSPRRATAAARRRPSRRTTRVWWGDRTGRPPDERRRPGAPPATEATTVAASAASSSRSGSSPGIVRASSVLPAPGGPTQQHRVAAGERDLERPSRDAPARARPRGRPPARRCRGPARGSPPRLPVDRRRSPSARGSGTRQRPRRARGDRDSLGRLGHVATPAAHRCPATSRASSSAAAGTSDPRHAPPLRARGTSAGSPGTRRTSPPSPSSPISATRPGATRSCSDPSRIPSAIARSSDAPALRSSAGARLTVIRRGGWW